MPRQDPQNVVYEKSDSGVVWKLLQYVSPMSRKAIDDWRTELSIQRRADCDVFLRNLVKLPRWKYPDVDSLKGKKFSGFYELRWKSQKVPHRIGGYFGGDGTFVMLVGWTHNAKKYDPPLALELLPKRKRQLFTNEATLCVFTIFTGRTIEG